MKKTIRNIAIAAATVLMSGCNDYLDVVPKNDITTINTTFEKREDAYDWLKTCFAMRDDDIASVYQILPFGALMRSWQTTIPTTKALEVRVSHIYPAS